MIIPVFDIKNGVFVSGKGGQRDSYTQLDSVFGRDIESIVHNLKDNGASMVYIADLDKIEGVGDNCDLISRINDIIPVILDNGANCMEDILFNQNICTYHILATETMDNLQDIEEIFEKMPRENIFISIDIKDNEMLVQNKEIQLEDICRIINNIKINYTIILNISQVGTNRGNITPINKKIIEKTPYTQHIIGGGLTNESIFEYKNEGIGNFLIGTLLHEGRLSDKHSLVK